MKSLKNKDKFSISLYWNYFYQDFKYRVLLMISFSNSISVSRLKSCISIVNLRDQFSAPGGRFSWVQLSCMQINRINLSTGLLRFKDVIQGKLFQKCTHLLYCSVLSLGGNVNTRRMSKPGMGSIFHIKKSMKYSGYRKLLCELSKLSKFNAFNLLGY